MIYSPALYDQLNATVVEFKGLVDDVQSGKGSLGPLFTSDEAYKKAITAIDKINAMIDDLQAGQQLTQHEADRQNRKLRRAHREPRAPFPAALALLRSGRVDPRPLISRVFPLMEADEAIRYAQQTGMMKVLLQYPASSR